MSKKRRKGGRRARSHRPSKGRRPARAARARKAPPPRRHAVAKQIRRPGAHRAGDAGARSAPPARLLPHGGTPIIVTATRPGAPRPGAVAPRPAAPARPPGTAPRLGNGPGAPLARPGEPPPRPQPVPSLTAASRAHLGPKTFRPLSSAAAPAGPLERHPARRPAPAPRRRDVCAMILAAGLGKRMLSQSSKLIHSVAGRPMVRHVVEAAKEAGMSRTVVVVGNQADDVRRAVGENDKRVGFAYQDAQRGTGHAVLAAERSLAGYEGDVLILNGDLPALRPGSLRTFVEFHRSSGAPLSLMTALVESPAGYGRVIRTYNGDVSRIVEESDATIEEKSLKEINCGIYCVETTWLWDPLKRARADNAQREIYLTDLIEILRRDGHKVAAYRHPEAEEVLGVNDRRELAAATRSLHRRKAGALMTAGVTILDPETTYIDVDVKVGQDTLIEPGVMLRGSTEIGRNVTIGAGCRITNSVVGDATLVLPYCVISTSRIGRSCRIGPFAHLRPETHLDEEARIGNFVETKKIHMGQGSKANHLTYLGDAEIGRRANIGAGTITCNYDGVEKLRTIIEDEVFIGSDTQLVAPVRVRRGAYVGAGSTITRDVPPHALALSRAEQVVKEDWARRFSPAARRKRSQGKGESG